MLIYYITISPITSLISGPIIMTDFGLGSFIVGLVIINFPLSIFDSEIFIILTLFN